MNGPRRKLDVGRINGEHFAVMAGAGLDADDPRCRRAIERTDLDVWRTS